MVNRFVVVETKPNRLFYGDNITIMQGMKQSEVDLIYLDPPFNSQRTYNLIYKQPCLSGCYPWAPPIEKSVICSAWIRAQAISK